MVSSTTASGARRLAMFPLARVLFPTAPLALHVFETRYRAMVDECLRGDGELGITLITRGSEVGGGDERASVGTLARIERAQALPDGRWLLVVRGQHRLKVAGWLPDDPHPQALVVEAPDHRPQGPRDDGARPEGARQPAVDELGRAHRAILRCRALASELGYAPALPGHLVLDGDATTAGWQLCGAAPLGPFDGQKLLEIDDATERLSLLSTLTEQLADDLARGLSDRSAGA